MALAETAFVTADGVRETDLAHLFQTIITPHFVMAMLRDLWAVGSVSQAQCAVIEECVLRCVSRRGTWQTVEGHGA